MVFRKNLSLNYFFITGILGCRSMTSLQALVELEGGNLISSFEEFHDFFALASWRKEKSQEYLFPLFSFPVFNFISGCFSFLGVPPVQIHIYSSPGFGIISCSSLFPTPPSFSELIFLLELFYFIFPQCCVIEFCGFSFPSCRFLCCFVGLGWSSGMSGMGFGAILDLPGLGVWPWSSFILKKKINKKNNYINLAQCEGNK